MKSNCLIRDTKPVWMAFLSSQTRTPTHPRKPQIGKTDGMRPINHGRNGTGTRRNVGGRLNFPRPSLQAVFRVVKTTAGRPWRQGKDKEGMMRYGFSNYPSFFDTNIRPGHIWEWDEDYPIIGALDAPDFIPAGACFRFTPAIPNTRGRNSPAARIHGGGIMFEGFGSYIRERDDDRTPPRGNWRTRTHGTSSSPNAPCSFSAPPSWRPPSRTTCRGTTATNRTQSPCCFPGPLVPWTGRRSMLG